MGRSIWFGLEDIKPAGVIFSRPWRAWPVMLLNLCIFRHLNYVDSTTSLPVPLPCRWSRGRGIWVGEGELELKRAGMRIRVEMCDRLARKWVQGFSEERESSSTDSRPHGQCFRADSTLLFSPQIVEHHREMTWVERRFDDSFGLAGSFTHRTVSGGIWLCGAGHSEA